MPHSVAQAASLCPKTMKLPISSGLAPAELTIMVPHTIQADNTACSQYDLTRILERQSFESGA